MLRVEDRRTALIVTAGAITLLAGSCSFIKPVKVLNKLTPHSGYGLLADIDYGEHERQTMDVYRPDEPADAPLIVFIYGGAWREGSKEEYKFVGQALASDGYTVVIPDYRLFPVVGYPQIINDVEQAVVTLRDQEAQLEIDAQSIVIAGHSSGAHSAAMLVSSPEYFAGENFIAGLIGISGPYDLPLNLDEVNRVFSDIQSNKSVKPPQLAKASHPPTLLLHGLEDTRVKPLHTRRYEEALKRLGVLVDAKYLDDTGHVNIIAGVATRLEFLNSTRAYINSFMSSL